MEIGMIGFLGDDTPKRGSPDKFCPGRGVECLPLAVIFMFPRLHLANALDKRFIPEVGFFHLRFSPRSRMNMLDFAYPSDLTVASISLPSSMIWTLLKVTKTPNKIMLDKMVVQRYCCPTVWLRNVPVAFGGLMAGLKKEDIEFIEQTIPPPHNSVERFQEAINRRLVEHMDLCTLVIKEVEKALLPLQNHAGRRRFFCRLDSSNQTKSPERIIQKIRTRMDKYRNPVHTWEDFTTTMKDLARFRIIVNFLGDIEKVVDAIKNHVPLSEAFDLEQENTMGIPLKERKSGERSFKLILTEKAPTKLSIEIQIMTAFQEAWDKKDHFLIYGKDRVEEEVPPQLQSLSLMTSELLYSADKYFEDFRKEEEGS